MADILVSHANADNGRVGALVDLLARGNWTVWWNQEVAPGEALDMAIEEELEQARIAVTVWPEHENPQAERSLAQFCQSLFRAGASIAQARDADSNPHMTTYRPLIDQHQAGKSFVPSSAQGVGPQPEFATVKLGEWTIEESENRIYRGDLVKKVTPRSMQVLMYLVQKDGTPASIERILNQIWRDRIVVESVVHRCINELREALEDDFKHPKYIETIPKRGNRIIAPLLETQYR